MGKRTGIFLILLIVFGAVSWNYFRTASIVWWGDSYDYVTQSTLPLTSRAFLAGSRPPLVPLVYKLFSQDAEAVIVFQMVLYRLAWLLFTAVVVRLLNRFSVKVLAVILLLGIALSTDVLIWQKLVLSESLSNTLLILVITAWLFALHFLQQHHTLKWQLVTAGVLLVLTTAWSFTRDTNAYIVLSAAGVILLAAVWKRFATWRPFMLFTGMGLVALFLVHNVSMNRSERWKYPLANVIAYRILPDADARAYFADHDLPINEETMRFSGYILAGEGGDWQAAFGTWMNENNARQIYLRYLLSRPVESFSKPLSHRVFEPKVYEYTKTYADPAPLYQAIDYLFYAPEGFWLLAALLVILSVILASAIRWRVDWRWLIPLFLLALVYPLGFLVWHSDPYDIDRHAIGVSLQFRLGLILLFLFALDTLPYKTLMRGLVAVVIPLLLLEVIFRLPETRTALILPAAAEFFPDENVLKTWNVSDAEYYAYADDLKNRVEKDALAVSPASSPEADSMLIHLENWSFKTELTGTALQKWTETLDPRFLAELDAQYVYADKKWRAGLTDFQKDMLTRAYDLIFEGNYQLYRVKADFQFPPEGQFWGMSQETFAGYEAHLQNSVLNLPADAVIFNPVTSELDWFSSAEDVGQFIEFNRDNATLLPALYDLLTVWLAMKHEPELNLSPPQQEALQKWRASKHSPYLREASIDYLLVSDLWVQYLSEEEFGLLLYSGGYQLVYEWQAEIPGSYKLYRVTG